MSKLICAIGQRLAHTHRLQATSSSLLKSQTIDRYNHFSTNSASRIFNDSSSKSAATINQKSLISPLTTQNQIQARHLVSGAKDYNGSSDDNANDKQMSLGDLLERELQDEAAELNQRLSSEQFPGFSVETDCADVKLTKQIGNGTVTVRFTVSSSLNEWPSEVPEQSQQQQNMEGPATTLVSMPEFQVQISKNNHTLELSCYFEEMDQDEESGEPYSLDPVFGVDELVMYEGEPKETEFAVSAEYFPDDMQSALLQYLAEHGVDDEFSKNLIEFATSYEKKQYISLLRRLKGFVSK